MTAAWARALDGKRRRWPAWALPTERPHGWRAGLWLAYCVLILLGGALACRIAWSILPGLWPWLVILWVVYTLVEFPFVVRRTLRTYWNAERAAEANEALLEHA